MRILEPATLFSHRTDIPSWLAPTLIVAVPTDKDPAQHPQLLTQAAAQDPDTIAAVPTWGSAKRRAHWLAGRLAAQEAARRVMGWTQARVETTQTGAPILTQGDQSVPVSITHSGTWALAALNPALPLLGIDFEVGVRDKLYLKERVCSRQEIELHGLEDPMLPLQERCDRLARIWVLKEALLKAYGVGLVVGLKDFHAQTLEYDSPLHFKSTQPLHQVIPHPLPSTLWSAVTHFDNHPLALTALEPST